MPNVTGCVTASFTAAGEQTRLSGRYHAYPLKIAKAFPFPEGQLGVYVMDASPGVMAGDRYVLDWTFGEQTDVYITNQSYTKVHPARDSDAGAAARPSSQEQRLTLGRDSYVEYMPEPLMLYKDAVFYSATDIRMDAGSVLIYADAVCPGRTYRGELFQYGLYQNRLTVTYDGELIYCAKQRIQPAAQGLRLNAIGGWAEHTHAGSLCVFSDRVDAAFIEALKDFLEERNKEHDSPLRNNMTAGQASRPGAPLYFGISRTYKYGLVLSVIGSKMYEIQELMTAAWQFTRQRLFAKPVLNVRK
ncbi:urease accessory protein UreD [Paenibacillus piri]|uniref:Urease accessory protein UreD n=1 Tax=Paenibacillus piri TaxID=2547395 RepID=A0A4R5KSM7_9BACL|nr:urease accessory protein UreD [Paenibacillus piri]TDF98873.1 urease accessory protein UreD [Paenibacillus piri]